MAIFNIGKEFSQDPSGRYYTDGPGSGEEFREDYLVPKINQLSENEILEIIIDDEVEAYGSSFISEGFAGAVKYGYFTADFLLNKIKIKYKNPDYSFFEKRIFSHIKKAAYNSAVYRSTKKNNE